MNTILTIQFFMWHKKYDFSRSSHTKPNHENFNSWDELEHHIKDHYHATKILPVYMYDHSEQTLSTTPFPCKWDSGQVGFVWTDNQSTSWDELREFIECIDYEINCEDEET